VSKSNPSKNVRQKAHHDPQKVEEIPEGMQFVMLSLELLASDAWRGLPINSRRFIDFLMIEHLRHAGRENGHLMALYEQLAKHGIAKKYIKGAIDEAERRGLVEVKEGVWRGTGKTPSTFRLTFLRELVRPADKSPYFAAPTNEWMRFKSKPKVDLSLDKGQSCHRTIVQAAVGQKGTMAKAETAENSQSAIVDKGEPLYISWDQPPSETAPATPSTGLRVGGKSAVAGPTRGKFFGVTAEAPRALVDKRPRDRDQITLEEAIAQAGNDERQLFEQFDDWLKSKTRGTLNKAAKRLNISHAQMSNFRAGRFGLNPGASRVLRQIINGEVAL
jgi:hypothetical protein